MSKIDKSRAEQLVNAALPPGWKFHRINWKKRIAHATDTHGRARAIPLGRAMHA